GRQSREAPVRPPPERQFPVPATPAPADRTSRPARYRLSNARLRLPASRIWASVNSATGIALASVDEVTTTSPRSQTASETTKRTVPAVWRSEEHTSELQS